MVFLHMTIAGHEFNILGICTKTTANGGVCPIRWPWLAAQCRNNTSVIGQLGYSHTATMTATEFEQVRVADEAEQDRMMEGVRHVLGGV